MKVDKFKLIHWLNVRKTTFEVLNQLIGNKINYKISRDNLDKIEDSYLLNLIAEKLNIPVEYYEDPNRKNNSYWSPQKNKTVN